MMFAAVALRSVVVSSITTRCRWLGVSFSSFCSSIVSSLARMVISMSASLLSV